MLPTYSNQPPLSVLVMPENRKNKEKFSDPLSPTNVSSRIVGEGVGQILHSRMISFFLATAILTDYKGKDDSEKHKRKNDQIRKF